MKDGSIPEIAVGVESAQAEMRSIANDLHLGSRDGVPCYELIQSLQS